MNCTENVVVILPSLNPNAALNTTVSGLIALHFSHIIVVNDGSKPEHLPLFEALSHLPECTVLHHSQNLGKGCALKTAFSHYLTKFDQDLFQGVITADADGQHRPSDILKCAQAMTANTLVLGTRDFSLDNVPPKSRFGNQLTTKILGLFYKKTIHDTQTGLRGIPNSLLADYLTLPGQRFEFEIQALIFSIKSRWSILEVAIDTVYFDNNRETHFHPIRDSFKIYAVIFKTFFTYSLSSLLCLLVDQGLFRLIIFLCLWENTATIGLATALARILSGYLNYTINKKVVFASSAQKTGQKYILLCAIQMVMSALLVATLFWLTQIDSSILKLLVDTCLFVISYYIQRVFIFKGGRQ